jgi:predicted unusual protein kinase regulating ubiquinone biosynthesis (AarF/ABC1/UbiB family)
MATPLGGERSNAREDARALALAVELGAQLGRLRGAGPKIRQILSMVQLDRATEGERSLPALGALPDGARAVPFGRARRVIEQDLDAVVRELFADVDEQPFALASLGQVHRARTSDGDDVAVKVQHPGVAEAVEGDLRDLGLVAPIVKRLAPGLDAGALLSEIRERISDELDYEVEAQHQRRLERLFRGHPHVRLPRVHTDLSTRRVLVTEYVEGLRSDEIKQLGDAERDRIGEIAFRFYFGLVWRDGAVAGDPHPDNCVLCPDGRLCLLDFGLLRGLDAGYLEGERDVMRALAGHDPRRVHDGLSSLGYLPQPRAVDRDALFEHLATAGEWLLAQGFRRVDPAYVTQILGRGYPPRSPYFSLMRRLRMPPPMLLLRRWSSRFSRCSATCTPEPTGVRSPPSTIRASRPRLPSGARITPLEAALVGLELVVQLVRDPLADPRPAPHPRRVRAQGAR